MKKILICIVLLIALISCQKKKMEFIYLDRLSGKNGKVYLINNPPSNKDSLKIKLTNFIRSNLKENFYKKEKNYLYNDQLVYDFTFYNKSSNTSYFIENKEDPGGHSSYEISNYSEDEIGYFSFSKCKNDTANWVGVFRFNKNFGKTKTEYDIEYDRDTLYSRCK